LLPQKKGSWYYVSFIDEHTHYYWFYLIKHYFEFFKIYIVFRALVKTQHSAVIKCFRCDLSGEYTSNKFYALFVLNRTIHQTLCTNTLEQNGIAKRKYKHIVENVCSFLLFIFVPNMFWDEVVLTAIGLINTISSSYTLCFSPFEKLYGYTLDYFFFRVFSYTYFILLPHIECNKLSSRSNIYIFLGYGEGKKRYHYFNPITWKLYVSQYYKET